MTSASGEGARTVLGPCAGQRIDEPQPGMSLWFGVIHVFILGVIGHAMFTSPWPGPAIIGVMSIPVLLVMRWQWRVLRGPQLHVEDAGVRIVEKTGDVFVVWDAMQLTTPFSRGPRGFSSPRLLNVRYAGADGQPVHFVRTIRADAPVRWELLE